MIQEEQDRLEAALRQIRPAALTAELIARLRAAEPPPRAASQPAPRTSAWVHWRECWRGLWCTAPAAALLLLIWFAWHSTTPSDQIGSLSPSRTKPNAVQVGHSLLASFDTVAQLPGGAPVRFRCREWQDDVVIHDRVQGVEVTQSTPRVEIIPLRFETY